MVDRYSTMGSHPERVDGRKSGCRKLVEQERGWGRAIVIHRTGADIELDRRLVDDLEGLVVGRHDGHQARGWTVHDGECVHRAQNPVHPVLASQLGRSKGIVVVDEPRQEEVLVLEIREGLVHHHAAVEGVPHHVGVDRIPVREVLVGEESEVPVGAVRGGGPVLREERDLVDGRGESRRRRTVLGIIVENQGLVDLLDDAPAWGSVGDGRVERVGHLGLVDHDRVRGRERARSRLGSRPAQPVIRSTGRQRSEHRDDHSSNSDRTGIHRTPPNGRREEGDPVLKP